MSIHTLKIIYDTLLYACALGQVVFLVAWFTVDWFKTLVGVVLMVKSFVLGLTLCTLSFLTLFQVHLSMRTYLEVYIALFAALFIGITGQDIAILREMTIAKKDRINNEE